MTHWCPCTSLLTGRCHQASYRGPDSIRPRPRSIYKTTGLCRKPAEQPQQESRAKNDLKDVQMLIVWFSGISETMRRCAVLANGAPRRGGA